MIKAHEAHVNAVAIDPDGAYVASAGPANTVKVWDLRAGREDIMEAHTGQVTALATSPDGKTIVSEWDDRTIRIWHARSRQLVRTLTGHAAADHTSLEVSSDGRKLVSSSQDRPKFESGLWLVEPSSRDWKDILTRSRSRSSIMMLRASRAYHQDNTIRIWETTLGVPLLSLASDGLAVSSVAFITSDRQLVSASFGGSYRVWDSEPGMHRGDEESRRNCDVSRQPGRTVFRRRVIRSDRSE